jgi:hypothetical protein
MKHPLSLLVLLLLIGLQVSEAQAQALRFDGGPVAGLNAAQVQGDDYTGFNKLGLSGGAFIDVRNPDNYWGIRLEMHYAEKGSRRGGDPEVGTTTIELRMNYIDIPILLDVNLGDYQVGFGPYFGRMIKAEKWQRVSDTSSSLEDNLNTWDVGGQAYARAPLGKSTFFQARISGSALSLKSDGPAIGSTFFGPRVRNIALHFGIGWSLRGNQVQK